MACLFMLLGMRYLRILCGMLIGKHKMAILSPKKSVEGGIGGIVGAALIRILYALAVNYWGNAGEDVLRYAIIGAAGGAISQIGDTGSISDQAIP